MAVPEDGEEIVCLFCNATVERLGDVCSRCNTGSAEQAEADYWDALESDYGTDADVEWLRECDH